MEQVDLAFIQSPEHRPKLHCTTSQNIPVIDLSPLSTSNNEHEISILVSEIGLACKEWGFFQVFNHGVPSTSRENIESASKRFFQLPKHEKTKISKKGSNPFGYNDLENTKNVRDWKEVFDFMVHEPTIMPVLDELDRLEVREFVNLWPDPILPELRVACEEHALEMERLAFKLLELISMSLGLRKDRLNSFFNEQTSRIRLSYYPPCPSPYLVLGVGRHKDSGALTILAQDDVGGLEVKRKADGEWIHVKPIPHAYIINVGDIIQVWSNDRYESVEHRVVVNSKRGRFSIPYFLYPAHYAWVEPLNELVNDEENPVRYKGYNWGMFRATRNRGNAMKLDVENLQISHFRI